ncbi:tetratricopeptide repeat protein [Candidatus Thiosymbion oneisti]|uniref:tetratricopeptide repeat protein n=1 Tax=Candidatus Thiosymbion oneisti TaxID=589554 RepID=UPI001060819E|nr:tetratricopeptide repeat protein [Candidatus Thiosymbion oneisti]
MRKWSPWIRQALAKIVSGIAEGIGNKIGTTIVGAVLLLFGALGYWLWQSDWWRPSNGPITTLLSQGDAYLGTGRYGLALAAYEAALERDSDNAAANFGRDKARIFAAMGPDFDAEAAGTALRAMAGNHPDDAQLQVMLGRLAAARGATKRARSHYERALELDPEVAQAWFALGVLEHDAGDLAAAREHYERAVKLAPDQRQYITNLAGVLLDQGDYQAALARYEDLLAVAPRLLLARLDGGNAARLAGRLDLARSYHGQLYRHLSQPGVFQEGDNAAQWVFAHPQGPLTMDASDTKRRYALLAVALTRWLTGDRAGARRAVDEARALADPDGRVWATIEQDLSRLERARPEWRDRIAAYRNLLGPPVP